MKTSIILINGEAGSGKDTLGIKIADQYSCNSNDNTRVVCLRFAGRLKKWCENMSGLKMQEIRSWNRVVDNIVKDFTQEQKDIFLPLWDMTLGQMLQKFATEGCRDGFDDLIWVKMLSKEINRMIEAYNHDSHNIENFVIIVPDFRFLNELGLSHFISHPHKYFTTKVYRDIVTNRDNDKRDMSHRSENDLNQFNNWDLQFFNNGTLDDVDKFAYSVKQFIQAKHK